MIVFYHNDPDGRCAAAIVSLAKVSFAASSDAYFVPLNYKDDVPLNLVRKNDVVFIVDFSLPPPIMTQLLQLTPPRRVHWCDHHATAKEYEYGDLVNGYRDFSDKGLSGAECTWAYVFPGQEIPYGVKLLGDYDSWRLTIPDSRIFYEGLKLYDQDPQSDTWTKIFAHDDAFIKQILRDGRAALRYRDNYCTNLRAAFGYTTSIDGIEAYALNVYQLGSGAFGDILQRVPICIAYIYDGFRFTVSLYSDTVDVSAIAKRHGGGGHKGAAGFVTAELPFYRS